MSNTQPEALRLAEALTPPTYPDWVMSAPQWFPNTDDVRDAAAELRRLQAENEVLKSIASIAHCGGMAGMTESDALIAIRRATLPYFVTEATEEQHRIAIASVKDAA